MLEEWSETTRRQELECLGFSKECLYSQGHERVEEAREKYFDKLGFLGMKLKLFILSENRVPWADLTHESVL